MVKVSNHLNPPTPSRRVGRFQRNVSLDRVFRVYGGAGAGGLRVVLTCQPRGRFWCPGQGLLASGPPGRASAHRGSSTPALRRLRQGRGGPGRLLYRPQRSLRCGNGLGIWRRVSGCAQILRLPCRPGRSLRLGNGIGLGHRRFDVGALREHFGRAVGDRAVYYIAHNGH